MAAPGRRWSLRNRLIGVAIASALAAWVAGAVAIYFAMAREGAHLFDARLADLAQTVLAFADHEIREIEERGEPVPTQVDTEGTASGRYRFQIWSRDGRLVMASSNAPRARPLMPLADDGWATVNADDQAWRVVTVTGPGERYRIQAAEPVAERRAMAGLFSRYLASGVALSALLLVLICVFLLRLAMRPVLAATAHLGERGPDDLRAIDLRNLPVELAPLLAATNRMMQRVDVALRSEREFVAAAAHELRTPLAGLRAQAELAAHPRTDAPARAEALRAVQDGVDHAAHLVGQLLDLARSDALAGDAQREALARQPVDLRELLAQLMPELGPPLAERDVQLRQALEVPVIDGSAVALALILRNLLANAVAHARPGGVVSIATRRQAGCTVLVVEDDGPGVPEAERARLCERFYRGRNPAAPGCGLGLAIVKALADAHGATIAFDRASLGGLAVRLSFPS